MKGSTFSHLFHVDTLFLYLLHPFSPKPSEKLDLISSPDKSGRMPGAMGEVYIYAAFIKSSVKAISYPVQTPFSALQYPLVKFIAKCYILVHFLITVAASQTQNSEGWGQKFLGAEEVGTCCASACASP